jgi:hypothetical protein
MASSEKEEINKTKDEEFKAPCTECAGKTHHKVLLSIDKSGEEHDGDFDFYWDAHFQIVQCQGCKTISFRHTNSNSEDYEPISHDEWQHVVYEDLYPSRVEGRKGIEDEILYLPTKIQRIYKETLHALNSRSPVLAGIGLRALVETVCKEESASGKDLLKKIDDLVAKNVLTPAGAQILHKIRTLGNEAAHEVKPHNDKQLGLAMDVVEHLLKDVYIIPKQVEAEFDN